MKIRLKHTVTLHGTYPVLTFHKGRIYSAIPATNQPEWQARGLVFVFRKAAPDASMLINSSDYSLA